MIKINIQALLVSLGLYIALFFFSYYISDPLFAFILPAGAGWVFLKDLEREEALGFTFNFMIFNVLWFIILIPIFKRYPYSDLFFPLFPTALHYINISPFLFSLSALLEKKKFYALFTVYLFLMILKDVTAWKSLNILNSLYFFSAYMGLIFNLSLIIYLIATRLKKAGD